jgi:hypothetical protein
MAFSKRKIVYDIHAARPDSRRRCRVKDNTTECNRGASGKAGAQ